MPWTEGTGYWTLWSAPKPINVGKDIVAETREQWKKEARANDIVTLAPKWVQEFDQAPAKDREKIKAEIKLARYKATLRGQQLNQLQEMSDMEVLDWLKQDENFDTTFPEESALDAASRKKMFDEWEKTVLTAKEWNTNVGRAEIDYRRIAFEFVTLTALCAVGLLLTLRS